MLTEWKNPQAVSENERVSSMDIPFFIKHFSEFQSASGEYVVKQNNEASIS
jgi:hypothetical protein